MIDDKLIMMISLLYIFIYLILHIIFFLTTIYNYKYQYINRFIKKNNSNDRSILNEEDNLEISKISSSSLILNDNIQSKKKFLNPSIYSFCFLLFICLLITNWLRLILIYIFPKFYPNITQSLLNFCPIQSFSIHILTLFHIHLIICLHFLLHYCFIFDKYWQTITYKRILYMILFILLCLCLFTLPSLSNQWSSIIYDKILQICIVDYTFNYSYTFFVLIFTCLIPFILLIISHKQQMKTIKNHLSKNFLIYQNLYFYNKKIRFQYTSYIILFWSFFNILLLIFLHISIKSIQIRISIYYIEIISLLFDPIIFIFIFRSLPIITLSKQINQIYVI